MINPELGKILRHKESNLIGLIVDCYYFDDLAAKEFNEYWFISIYTGSEILEGWQFDFEHLEA